MRRAILMLSAWFGLWVGQAGAETVERVLANGMKVIVKTDHRAPVAVSQLWYRAGSMDESYGTTGVAHVLEHMMFKGTTKVPGGEFSRRIAAAGARFNAFTSRDQTIYLEIVQAGRLDLAFELEADRMANLVLDAGEFAREIQVVMEERRMRTDDNPQALLYEKLVATAFAEHPYRHPIIGWMNDLRNMSVDDARRWYQEWYTPSNATLVVVGDVVPDHVFGLAERHFGALQAKPVPQRKHLDEPPQQGMKEVTLRVPAKLPAVIYAWRAPRLTDPGRDWEPYAVEVLQGILVGHDSARLPQALVKEKRLAVEVDADYDAISRGPAQFMVMTTPTEGTSVAELQAGLRQEIRRLQEDGVGAAELRRAKAQVLARRVFEQDSLFVQAMQIGTWENTGLPWQEREVRFERLKAVTAEQVQAVARKYFVDDALTVAQLDPLPLPTGPTLTRNNGGNHVR